MKHVHKHIHNLLSDSFKTRFLFKHNLSTIDGKKEHTQSHPISTQNNDK